MHQKIPGVAPPIPVAPPPIPIVAPNLFSERVSESDSAVPASKHTIQVARQLVLNDPILMKELPFVNHMVLPPPNLHVIHQHFPSKVVEMQNNKIIKPQYHPSKEMMIHSIPGPVPVLNQPPDIIAQNITTKFKVPSPLIGLPSLGIDV